MLDNSIGCYGKLVSEVLTAISQVYWGRMYKSVSYTHLTLQTIQSV